MSDDPTTCIEVTENVVVEDIPEQISAYTFLCSQACSLRARVVDLIRLLDRADELDPLYSTHGDTNHARSLFEGFSEIAGQIAQVRDRLLSEYVSLLGRQIPVPISLDESSERVGDDLMAKSNMIQPVVLSLDRLRDLLQPQRPITGTTHWSALDTSNGVKAEDFKEDKGSDGQSDANIVYALREMWAFHDELREQIEGKHESINSRSVSDNQQLGVHHRVDVERQSGQKASTLSSCGSSDQWIPRETCGYSLIPVGPYKGDSELSSETKDEEERAFVDNDTLRKIAALIM